MQIVAKLFRNFCKIHFVISGETSGKMLKSPSWCWCQISVLEKKRESRTRIFLLKFTRHPSCRLQRSPASKFGKISPIILADLKSGTKKTRIIEA